MYPIGHFGMALLFAAPVAAVFHPRAQTGFTVYTLMAAWLPDFDMYIPGLVHAGITHTVMFAVVAGIAGGALAAVVVFVAREWISEGFVEQFDPTRVFAFVGVGLFIGVISHLVADILILVPGTRPVSPFWPISNQIYQFGITSLGAPVRNAVMILVGLAVHGVISWRASPEGDRILSTV